MTLKEAQILVLRVLKQVMEEKLDQHNVQLAQASSLHNFVSDIFSPCHVSCPGDNRKRV